MKIPFKDGNKSKKYIFINISFISNEMLYRLFTKGKNVNNSTLIMNERNKDIKEKQKEDKGKIKLIKRKFKFYPITILATLLLIQVVFSANYQNKIIAKDSSITLRVSRSGEQKIFNAGTRPNKIWIDNNMLQISASNSYNLNPTNIIKLKWTNNIENCEYMFQGCNSIIEMNFNNFDATRCINFSYMFKDCESLTSIDLSGFITSNSLRFMASLFNNCYSLKSVNLSTFETSQATNFGHMFCNCKSLTSIYFPDSKIEKAKYMDNMFIGCEKLTSLNLSNFITFNTVNIENMFSGCKSLKLLDISNFDVRNVRNINNIDNIFTNCDNLVFINIYNINSNRNLQNKFFDGIQKDKLIICIDNDKTQIIKDLLDNNICIIISCDESLINYEYKLNTENGCLTRKCSLVNYKYEFQKSCYEECPDNSIEREDVIELEEKYFCKPICNETYPFEIISEQKCVKNCDIKTILNKSCIINKENSYDALLKSIEKSFTSEDYDTSDIDSGINNVIKYNHLTVTLTSTKNQKIDEKFGNVTTINLGNCEDKLKDAYNISYNESLYIKKIDVIEEGMMIPKIEYDVYYKLNQTNLVKLDLSYCSNSKIDISIPITITDNIDKYNANSGFYNDICYPSTSDDGTDVILKDRKSEFINNNLTICQDNCILSEYDSIINSVKCSCDVAKSSSLFENIKIDKEKLFKNFIDIKNIANINILVCYKVLFTKKGLIKNYGSYFMILIIFIHLIIIITFYAGNFYNKIKNIIKKISLGIDKSKFSQKENGKIKNDVGHLKNKQKIKLKNSKIIESNSKNNLKKGRVKNFKSKTKKIPNVNSRSNKIMIINKNINILNNKSKTNKKKDNDSNKVKKATSFNDEELNNLDYELALRYDKRNYCQYYFSLLKAKHAIIFAFCNNTDYNLKIIKIDLFLFNLTLFYFVNTIFFDDKTMHKIYEDKGSFDIIGQIPQIIYSSLISMVFSIILEFLALTGEVIIELKKIKLSKNFNKKIKSLGNKIKIKFVLYFIISTIFLLCFWYYLSMFCAIYVNTQIHLIKDTLLSFLLSLIEPFGIYLIPGLVRIPSLSKPNCKFYINLV